MSKLTPADATPGPSGEHRPPPAPAISALEQAYVDKVHRGEQPTLDEAIAFLQGWHARHPGATGRVLAPFRLTSGQSSYEWLAGCVAEGQSLAVLDLCCGDGVLAEQALRRLGPEGSVVGVDASEEDLALARARLADPRAQLRPGLASALPLPTATIDVVLCHYALMLIRPLDAAVREIARVLRPGGLFAAIVPLLWNLPAAAPDFAALLQEVRAKDLHSFPLIGLGDPLFALGGPRSFFHAANGFAPPVSVQTLELQMRSTPDEILRYVELTYLFDLFLPEHQRRLHEEGKPMLTRAAGPDGRLPLIQNIQLLTIRRA